MHVTHVLCLPQLLAKQLHYALQLRIYIWQHHSDGKRLWYSQCKHVPERVWVPQSNCDAVSNSHPLQHCIRFSVSYIVAVQHLNNVKLTFKLAILFTNSNAVPLRFAHRHAVLFSVPFSNHLLLYNSVVLTLRILHVVSHCHPVPFWHSQLHSQPEPESQHHLVTISVKL